MNLSDLPYEVLDHIFTHLDTDHCFERQFHLHPKSHLLSGDSQILKNISLTSHRFRNTVLPRLFTRTQLDPAHLTEFIAFVQAHTFGHSILSIVAHIHGPIEHIHSAWWCKLLNSVPTPVLIIAGRPTAFSEAAKVHVTVSDSWAFNIPCQLLELRQSPEIARQQVSYNNLPSVFAARPWHSMRVNEGSSLAAYTRYEYYLKKTPSIMADLQLQLNDYMLSAGSIPHDMMPYSLQLLQRLFETLIEFTFVAVFPFYNHTDEILKCVRRMTSLRKLTVKLCPEPESTVLEDEMRATNHHIDLNDPWSEFNTSYVLIAHCVIALGEKARLERFVSDDVKMVGIRKSLEDTVNTKVNNRWVYDGNGTWCKALGDSLDWEQQGVGSLPG